MVPVKTHLNAVVGLLLGIVAFGALIFFLVQNDGSTSIKGTNNIRSTSDEESENSRPSAATTGTPAKNASDKADLIKGIWYCKNGSGYVNQDEYKANGDYLSYESGLFPGVVGNHTVSYTGTYTVQGDVLRSKLVNPDGNSFTWARRIERLDSEVLHLRDPKSGDNESCDRPID